MIDLKKTRPPYVLIRVDETGGTTAYYNDGEGAGSKRVNLKKAYQLIRDSNYQAKDSHVDSLELDTVYQ